MRRRLAAADEIGKRGSHEHIIISDLKIILSSSRSIKEIDFSI